MKSMILTSSDIRKIVQAIGVDRLMDELIFRLVAAFTAYDSEDTIIPVRSGFSYTGLRERMTVFDSTGWALEDQVALGMMLDFADEMEIGQQMMIEQLPIDPQDPSKPTRQSVTQSISQTGRI